MILELFYFSFLKVIELAVNQLTKYTIYTVHVTT
jgi:hypothetical protein